MIEFSPGTTYVMGMMKSNFINPCFMGGMRTLVSTPNDQFDVREVLTTCFISNVILTVDLD